MPVSGRRTHPRRLVVLIATLVLLALAAGSVSAHSGLGEPALGTGLRFQVNAALSPESRENTSVMVQNNSPDFATVAMDYYTPAGQLIPAARQMFEEVPGWGTRTFEQAFHTGLLPGFRGVGVLSSDQPLNVLLLREVVGTGGVRSYSIQNAPREGGTRVVLPYVANQLEEGDDGEVVNTRFSIANAGLEVACVTLTFRHVPGRGATPAEATTTYVLGSLPGESCPDGGHAIPVAGQLTLAPDEGSGATAMPPGTVNALMSVFIDSSQPITVAADIYRGDDGSAQLGSYNGFAVIRDGSNEDDVGRHVILPLAQKTADGFWTQFAIANPWSEVTTGTIDYQGTVGGDSNREVEVSVDIEIPARGSITHSVLDSEDLPEGFIGHAVVRADLPVAALLLRGKLTNAGSSEQEDAYSVANGVPRGRATTSAKFPLAFRHLHASGESLGTNTWVSVVVADGGKARLRIIAVNDASAAVTGCERPALYQTTITIDGSFVFDQGSSDRGTNGLNAKPTCLIGGMAISSDKPIVAIGAVTSDLQPGDNDALYNAFP